MSAERTCSVEGCERTGKMTRGWCLAHYARWHYSRDVQAEKPIRVRTLRISQETVEEYFWARVSKGDSCWEWTGARAPAYGNLPVRGKTVSAHRFSYELHFGPIPEGMCVCHSCDNPPCVRPDHLFLGTHLDNARDRDAKGRGNKGRKFRSRWA